MNIEQGTEDWLELRKGKITASKIPVILGISPYQTPFQLWEEELGFREPQKTTDHMKRGLDIEDAARKWAIDYHQGCPIEPKVVFSKDNPKFMASLDGLSATNTFILEIKNNNKEYHELARKGSPVDFHIAQMQWQMYCADVKIGWYLSWREGDPIMIHVIRNEDFIEKSKHAAYEFLRMLDDLEQPELTERDYVDARDDVFLADKARLYKYYTAMSREFASKSEAIKEELHSYANGRNVIGNGIKITRYNIPGRLDYNAIMNHHNIDLEDCEQFRKPEITSYRITT